jgi:hypothetical protein
VCWAWLGRDPGRLENVFILCLLDFSFKKQHVGFIITGTKFTEALK